MAEAPAPFTPAEIARIRAETPGLAHGLHLDSAGCALPPAAVVEAMVDHLRLEVRLGGLTAWERRQDRLERPYAALARLLNCGPDEIALTESATRAWDMAFYALRLAPGDRVLTAQSEYCSNFIAMLHRARRDGIAIDVAPTAPGGAVCIEAMARLAGPRTRLIALTHVPSTDGVVNPAAEVGRLARSLGVPFLLDACQSVGQIAVDVQAIGCDMLSGTARKFLRGPRGVGFLHVRRGLLGALDPPMIDDHAADWCADDAYALRPDARRFESFECSFAGRAGFGVALDIALGWTIPRIEARVAALAAELRAALAAIPGVAQHDGGPRRCGIVTFTLAGRDAAAVHAALAAQAITVSLATSEATRLDMLPRGLARVLRASVHYYNDENEIDRFAAAVARLARDAAA